MSLINKMLRDIESRQPQTEAPRPAPVKPVYQDLRPTAHSLGRRSSSRIVSIAIGLTLVASITYYAWQREQGAAPMAHTIPAAPAQTAKSAPTPSPTPFVPAAVTTKVEPTSPPAVVETAAAPAPSVPEADKAVAVPSGLQSMPVERVSTVTAEPPAASPTATALAVSKPVPPAKPIKPIPVAADTAGAEASSIDKRVRPLSAEEKAESDYRQAARWLDQGRPHDANRLLAQVISTHPQHTRARELLIALALQNGRTREAQQLLEEGVRLVPKHYPFVYLSARLQVEQGADGQALSLLERAASLAQGDADYQSLLAALYQRQGRHGDAVAAYRRTVELRPHDARAWVGLGISLEVERELDAARISYQRARDLGDLPPALARHASQRLAQLAQP